MSPDQTVLVQEGWQRVRPMADEAMSMFYDRLFEIDPKLRRLFTDTNMTQQHARLATALDTVVGALDNLDDIVPHIRALGRRHANYGVTRRHFDTVGAALLWTLEKGLGEAWSADACEAWSNAYAVVAQTMQTEAGIDTR